MKKLNNLQVFISAPSDLAREKENLHSAIEQMNRELRLQGYHVTLIDYTKDVSPGQSERAQQVINNAIGDDYDVYLGILGARFGTSTGLYDSGTEEEFQRALKRKREGRLLEVMFFFKHTNVDPFQIDPSQLVRVSCFRDKLVNEGVLWGQFSTDVELSNAVRLAIARLIKQHSETEAESHGKLAVDAISPAGQAHLEPQHEGLLEVAEESMQSFRESTEAVAKIQQTLQDLDFSARSLAEQMNSISSNRGHDFQRRMHLFKNNGNEMGRRLLEAAVEIEGQIEVNERSLKAGINSLAEVAIISLDFPEGQNGTSAMKSLLQGIIAALDETIPSISQFSKTVISIPNLTNNVAIGKRRLFSVLNNLETSLRSSRYEALSTLQLLL